jgi:glutamate--cysteine ligase
LDARVGDISMLDLSREVLRIAEGGLQARARAGAGGLIPDETHFLAALQDSVEIGKTPADEMLDRYHGEWDGDLSQIYGAYRY